jgi:cytoskeletal protein CcmA (bactofilin family)
MDIASLIQKQVSIKGSLSFSQPLFFDGQIEGDLETTGSLTIGENGRVNGNIRAKELVVWGAVQGNMHVDEACSLERDATVNGDVVARILRMEEGATFNGMADIDPLRGSDKPAKVTTEPTKNPEQTKETADKAEPVAQSAAAEA